MDFTELTALLDQMPVFNIPACDCVVTHHGRQVYRHTVGLRDLDTKEPLTGKDTYFLYSATKVSTCTGVMLLLERGALRLEDPVSRYLPAFADMQVREKDGTLRPAAGPVTIRHLLTMTAGLTYDTQTEPIRKKLAETGGRGGTVEMMEAIAASPLIFDPGAHFNYSLCHDVLGAVIEVVSGVSFGTFLERELFGPLGMTDTTFHPNADQRARLVWQYTNYDHRTGSYEKREDTNRFVLGTAYESGGAGLVSTVDDYIRLGTMMALGGVTPEGKRILRQETLDLMRADSLAGDAWEDFRRMGKLGYSYGLGVRTMIDPHHEREPKSPNPYKRLDPAESPVGEYGWDGAAGAFLVIDPVNEISLWYLQHEFGAPWHHPAIRDAAYRGLLKR